MDLWSIKSKTMILLALLNVVPCLVVKMSWYGGVKPVYFLLLHAIYYIITRFPDK